MDDPIRDGRTRYSYAGRDVSDDATPPLKGTTLAPGQLSVVNPAVKSPTHRPELSTSEFPEDARRGGR